MGKKKSLVQEILKISTIGAYKNKKHRRVIYIPKDSLFEHKEQVVVTRLNLNNGSLLFTSPKKKKKNGK